MATLLPPIAWPSSILPIRVGEKMNEDGNSEFLLDFKFLFYFKDSHIPRASEKSQAYVATRTLTTLNPKP